MSENNVNRLKTFARTEREQIREQFIKRASEPPIVNPFDAESMRTWDEYVAEMQGLERMLKDAGDQL